MPGPTLREVLYADDGRLRSAWRMALFGVLFALLAGTLGTALVALQAAAGLSVAGGMPSLGMLALQAGVGLVAAVAAGWIVLRWVDRRPPGALGFAWTPAVPRELALGMAIGGGSLVVGVAALAAAGRMSWGPDEGTAAGYAASLARGLALFGVAAAWEEALFRGYPFQALVEGIGAAPATVLASAAFALAHAGNPNVDAVALVNIFLAGVMLSVAYLRTRSLWFATAAHVGWNWTMASVLALPVSGWMAVDTPLYDARIGDPRWLTGGAFGPEGGLVATLGFALALAAVLRLRGVREAPEMRALRPLVDSRLREE